MYIGIDIGGTKIALGILDKDLKVLHHKAILTQRERKAIEVIEDIIRLITESIAAVNSNRSLIKNIGIGIPGQVDNSGNVIQCVNLGWSNIPLKNILEAELDLPVIIDNDASLAALAEYKIGAMKDRKCGVLLTLGTGIGGGIIVNGKILKGFHGVGSEIGHMVIGKNYYNCNCGKNGCFETFASASALKNYTKRLLKNKKSKVIDEMTKGNINRLNGKIIFEAAYQGDEIATKAVDRMVKYLGIGIVNLVNIIDPEIFVIGGGLSKSGIFLLDKLKKEVEENKLVKGHPIGEIVLAELDNKAGFIGAALLGRY